MSKMNFKNILSFIFFMTENNLIFCNYRYLFLIKYKYLNYFDGDIEWMKY